MANTGNEIPQAELLRIFEKFYRIPNCDPWHQRGKPQPTAVLRHVAERQPLCGKRTTGFAALATGFGYGIVKLIFWESR